MHLPASQHKPTGPAGGHRRRARRVLAAEGCVASALGVAAGEDRRDVVQDVGGADFVVAEVADEARLDDVDLFLRFAVDDGADTSVFSLMLSF